ncbi:bile acid:sodium symporter family protein [Pararhodonellum marinum]|uniref:bile acid:sodium symporter family protein n=1 Tax=Pararhodonellum marinum TaxID=2755358 RepID=UPI00188F5BCD|nr:bile acid:sodium symporter family protein [Pararhodonellum marinum]
MNLIPKPLQKVGLNTFFLLLIAMIFLAYWFPEWGSDQSVLPLKLITGIGISVIFFFYGVKLDPKQLLAGLSNWRLHVTVQATTFLLFPLLVWLLYALWGDETSYLWLGTFYLAALPSTVSSSVVLVSMAGGNMPAAIFNASISSIIGIFITPVWMDLMLPESAVAFDLGPTFVKLILQILLPVLVGLYFHQYLGSWVGKHSRSLKNFDQAIILLIVFSAFSESFEQKMFEGQSAFQLISLGFSMLLLFLFMFMVMYLLAKAFAFKREDLITLVFCGSKKSLVQGAVMGRVMFPDPVVLGVILLPLMIYHALQLIVGSAIAQRWGMRKDF